MKSISQLSIALVALTLAACSSQQTATVTTTLAQICKAAQPVVIAAAQSPASSVATASNVLAKYLTPACNVDGTVAASLVPNIDASTPVWLEGVVKDFATVAGIIIPELPTLLAL